MKLKEAYNYGRSFPASRAATSDDLQKISGHLKHLRQKEDGIAINTSMMLRDMAQLELRENWLKSSELRQEWNNNYEAYLKDTFPELLDDFVRTFSGNLQLQMLRYKDKM